MARYFSFYSHEIYMYDALSVFSTIIFILYNFVFLEKKKYGLGIFFDSFYASRDKSHVNIIYFFKRPYTCWFFETFFIVFASIYPALFMNDLFRIITDGNANYFGSLYTYHLFFFPFALLLGIDYLKIFDEIIPSYSLRLIFVKLACFCAGCCAGIECEHGMYNYKYDKVMFPVQLVEAGLALLTFVFMLLYKKKAKRGTMYPVYLIVYSGTRFFSEFLRIEPNVVFGCLKKYQVLCIIGVVLGVVELILVRKYGDRITLWFEKYNASYKVFLQKHIFKPHNDKSHKKSVKSR